MKNFCFQLFIVALRFKAKKVVHRVFYCCFLRFCFLCDDKNKEKTFEATLPTQFTFIPKVVLRQNTFSLKYRLHSTPGCSLIKLNFCLSFYETFNKLWWVLSCELKLNTILKLKFPLVFI